MYEQAAAQRQGQRVAREIKPAAHGKGGKDEFIRRALYQFARDCIAGARRLEDDAREARDPGGIAGGVDFLDDSVGFIQAPVLDDVVEQSRRWPPAIGGAHRDLQGPAPQFIAAALVADEIAPAAGARAVSAHVAS